MAASRPALFLVLAFIEKTMCVVTERGVLRCSREERREVSMHAHDYVQAVGMTRAEMREMREKTREMFYHGYDKSESLVFLLLCYYYCYYAYS